MKSIRLFLEEILIEFQKDEVIILSAAFVYYAALSFIPLFLFLLAILSLSMDWIATVAMFVDEQLTNVGELMGPEMQQSLDLMLRDLRRGSLIATAVALAIVMWGASIIFRFLRISFRKIYGRLQHVGDAADAARELLEYSTIDRFWGFLLVFLLGILFFVSLLVMAFVQAALYFMGFPATFYALYNVFDILLNLVIVMAILTLLYRFLPPISLDLRLIAPSALVASFAYALLRLALNIYFRFVAPANSYGALGTLLALLVFTYFAGLIFFIGAEITKVRMLRQVDAARNAASPQVDQINPEQ